MFSSSSPVNSSISSTTMAILKQVGCRAHSSRSHAVDWDQPHHHPPQICHSQRALGDDGASGASVLFKNPGAAPKDGDGAQHGRPSHYGRCQVEPDVTKGPASTRVEEFGQHSRSTHSPRPLRALSPAQHLGKLIDGRLCRIHRSEMAMRYVLGVHTV